MEALAVYGASIAFFIGIYVLWHGFGCSGVLSRVYSNLESGDRALFDSHVVSNLHVLVAVYGGVSSYACDDALTNSLTSAFNESPARDFYLMITSGYLTYDLVMCLYYGPSFGDSLTILHHTLIVVAFSVGVATHIGTFYMASFLINEASTIFYNVNYILAVDPKLKSSLAYKVNGIALGVSFLVFRVMFNTYNLYLMATHSWWKLAVERNMWATSGLNRRILCPLLSFLAIGHCLINYIWFYQIQRAVRRKLRSRAPFVMKDKSS